MLRLSLYTSLFNTVIGYEYWSGSDVGRNKPARRQQGWVFPAIGAISAAAAALQAAVKANHFVVMQVHNLKEIMTKKGVEFVRECMIFEVCQPKQTQKVLDQDLSVSTALPCRISIYEEKGKTIPAFLKPTALLAMFNVPRLEMVARDIENTIINILKEVAFS